MDDRPAPQPDDAAALARVRALADEYERHAGLMAVAIGLDHDWITRRRAFEDAAASIRRALRGEA